MDQQFSSWFEDYMTRNESVLKVFNLLRGEGEEIVNDHVALRTLKYDGISKDDMAKYFEKFGYKVKGKYHFKNKKLDAIHLEKENAPKIFISELLYEDLQFSTDFVETLKAMARDASKNSIEDLFKKKHFWDISFETYSMLAKESEYGSWLYTQGFRPNHFTVSVNHLKNFNELEKLNEFLQKNNLEFNESGGIIKGSVEQGLQQSSIKASKILLNFEDGNHTVPGCYYEFAQRYKINGELFEGFIEGSADKIFESTNS